MILAQLDLFAGPFIDAAIRAAFGGPAGAFPLTVTLPLAGPFAALTIVQQLSLEPGTPARTITLPGLPFTLALDRAHDVTVRMA